MSRRFAFGDRDRCGFDTTGLTPVPLVRVVGPHAFDHLSCFRSRENAVALHAAPIMSGRLAKSVGEALSHEGGLGKPGNQVPVPRTNIAPIIKKAPAIPKALALNLLMGGTCSRVVPLPPSSDADAHKCSYEKRKVRPSGLRRVFGEQREPTAMAGAPSDFVSDDPTTDEREDQPP